MRLLAILLSLLFLFAASCSRGQSGNETAPPETEAPATEPAEPSPVQGGLLRMAMPENLQVGNESYDPMIVNTEEALGLYSLVYEPLIAVDEQNAPVPCLAQNWSVMPHLENAFQIKLREGVRFHSGDALTADDVIYSFEHLVSLGSESYYRRSAAAVTNITKLDRSTLIVRFKDPGMIGLYALNFPIMKRYSSRFNGTGCYRVDSVSEELISLSVNSDWWDRPPYIDRVEFIARDSNETALASYSAGQLDMVPTALLTAGKYGDAGVTVVRDYMTQGMETMLFNHRRLLTSDARFRRAVAHSINRTRIIANVYMNRARSCDVPVPPDSWLYNGSNQQIDYNASEAQRLFEEAGCRLLDDGLLYYGNSPVELTLLVSATKENTTRFDAASAIAAHLLQAGVTVNIVTADHGYGQNESEFMTALTQMNWDIALVGFNLSQSNELTPYLTSGGQNNYGLYPGGVFDALLYSARSAEDEESLRDAFYEIQAKFIDELPFLVLYFRLNSLVARSEISGITSVREPALLRNIKNWYYAPES